jgi:hypothetical protein
MAYQSHRIPYLAERRNFFHCPPYSLYIMLLNATKHTAYGKMMQLRWLVFQNVGRSSTQFGFSIELFLLFNLFYQFVSVTHM